MTHFILPALHISPTPYYKISSKRPISRRGSKQIRSTAIEPLSRYIKTVGDLVLSLKDGLTESEREERRLLEERKEILAARLQHAETYKQWDAAAHELDVLEGNEEWKADISTGDYNPDLIEARLEAMNKARTECDLHAMMHLVRTSLSRDLGGMGNIDLYRHSHCGTKKLIERYVELTLETITALVEQSARKLPEGLESKDLLDAVLFARQSFGRSALLLSGGGTFGMTHIGVLKALFENKLLPRIISGASAGSIICSVLCTRTDDEIPPMLDEFPYGDLSVFEEEGNEDGLIGHFRRLLTEGNWADIKHLTRVMRNLLGDMTFQEAYNRTRRICNICVSSASIYELPRLLNYVTAPNVMMWSAVAASCSVPLFFSAAPLLVKDPLTGKHNPWNPTPEMWIDGSVDNDLPMMRLAEMFNVNHFIVCQVNPHVVPFLAKDDTPLLNPSTQPQTTDETDWLYTIMQLAKSEALHRMQFLAEIGIFPNLVSKLRSILSQKYSGDINIVPAIGVMDLPKIMKNPTREFMFRSTALGERATWPKLSRIRDSCAIELALDRAVHSLRARVVFSKSQVDLRRMAAGSLSNPFRGSHEQVNNIITHEHTGLSAKEKAKRRGRRSSITHMQLVPHHRRLIDDPYKLTDDDTDDEERLELVSRRSGIRKSPLKLKHQPKSNPLHCGPMTTPHLSSVNDPNNFDFASPLTPRKDQAPEQPLVKSLLIPTSVLRSIEVDDSPNITSTETASMTSPNHGTTHVPETETSDDADIDSHTDESGAETSVKSPELDTLTNAAQQDWLHEIDHGRLQRASAKDDMFSLAKREQSASSVVDTSDSGPGLWS